MEQTGEPAVRVLAIASAGGHFVQLCRLMPAFRGTELVIATTSTDFRDEAEVAAQEAGGIDFRFRTVRDAHRGSLSKLLVSAVGVALLLIRERPSVIVTTGAAPGYFALRLGRLMGARTVWLDSIANADTLSLSGEKAGKYADLWLTQWPEVADRGGARFEGSVL